MNSFFRFLFALLASWLLASPCLAQNEPDFLAVSDALFPESRSWPLFTAYPAFTAAELESLKAPLAQAVCAENVPKSSTLESDACSFIERAFKEELGLAAFRRIDLNQDGFPDVVYTGPAYYREGYTTIVWFGSAGGYTVKQTGMSLRWLLRVSPDGKKAAGVEPGCCASRSDVYSMDDTLIHLGGNIRILKDTTLPARRYDQARTFSTRHSVRLRSSPKISDKYDMNESMFLRHAAFGNVVSVFMAGVDGRILGEIEEKSDKKSGGKKRRWLFVVVESDGSRVLQDPYREIDGVNAGWLRADQVSVPAK